MSKEMSAFKFKIMLWKAYFDIGYGVTSYFKYLIAFYGISSLDVKWTMIAGVIYGISCFFMGWFLYKYGYIDAQHEVQNIVNPFVKEMRTNFGITNRKVYKG